MLCLPVPLHTVCYSPPLPHSIPLLQQDAEATQTHNLNKLAHDVLYLLESQQIEFFCVLFMLQILDIRNIDAQLYIIPIFCRIRDTYIRDRLRVDKTLFVKFSNKRCISFSSFKLYACTFSVET